MTQQSTMSFNGARLVRAAMLFVFAAATLLPFCTAFFLCSMPCCHGVSSATRMQAPMPACPGSSGCAPQLTESRDEQAVAATTPLTQVAKLIVTTFGADATRPRATEAAAEAPPAASTAPLHLLNSVFRI